MEQLPFAKGRHADLILGAFLSQKVNRNSGLLPVIRRHGVFRHGSSGWADGKESKNHHRNQFSILLRTENSWKQCLDTDYALTSRCGVNGVETFAAPEALRLTDVLRSKASTDQSIISEFSHFLYIESKLYTFSYL